MSIKIRAAIAEAKGEPFQIQNLDLERLALSFGDGRPDLDAHAMGSLNVCCPLERRDVAGVTWVHRDRGSLRCADRRCLGHIAGEMHLTQAIVARGSANHAV